MFLQIFFQILISNVPNNNRILLLDVKYQTIIIEWKDYEVLLSFIC